MKAAPGWGIGTAKRSPMAYRKNFVPGPDKYNLAKNAGEGGPAYHIATKSGPDAMSSTMKNVPGPG